MKLKHYFSITFILILFFANAQYNVPAISPKQKIEQQISISKITVEYGRPGVKGRKIFGELVPFGKVWRAGANEASKITFGQDFIFGGKLVKEGTYALYILPQANEWKIMLNKGVNNWGAYNYNEADDVLFITVPVKKLNDKVEWFTISFEELTLESIKIVLKWDTTMVEIPVQVAHPEQVSKIIENLQNIKKINGEIKKLQ